MPQFHYRQVGFGTRFELASGFRNNGENPASLFENELVADVGGLCLGWKECALPIFDHHFFREDDAQYPSAAAAILHQAHWINAYFEKLQARLGGTKEIWLVTHENRDFDAYCSLFLARAVLNGEIPASDWDELGLHPEGWKEFADKSGRKINWYEPCVVQLPPERRWPILLAAYASRVDNCKPITCPRKYALHAVLYAAKARQRPLEEGALWFFQATRDQIVGSKRLNPLTDALFDTNSDFKPELELLALEEERYQRDIRRARKVLVNLPSHDNFTNWYEEGACKVPLLNTDGSLCQEHLKFGRQSSRQVDGIYLRDPDSILFKEWARVDTQNSPSQQGFLFTAVTYSSGANDKPRYVFSLDPERASGTHLYPVWVILQAAEMGEMKKHSITKGKDRKGFEGRQCGEDPWFDGSNYRCTIVDSPRRGSLIPQADQHSFLDGPVALVRRELEYGWFKTPEAEVWDFAADHVEVIPASVRRVSIQDADKESPPKGAIRFAQIPLCQIVDLGNPQLRTQIGQNLWLLLEDQNVVTVPTDFQQRHLLGGNDLVLVWSRRGIAVAYKQEALGEVSSLKSSMKTWASIAALFQQLLKDRETGRSGAAQIRQGKWLLSKLLLLKHQSSLPEGKALRRLFEATRMDDLVSTLHEFNEQDLEELRELAEKKRDITLQVVLAVGMGLGLILSWHQTEQVKLAAVLNNHLADKDKWWIGMYLGLVFIGAYLLSLAVFFLKENRQRRSKQHSVSATNERQRE